MSNYIDFVNSVKVNRKAEGKRERVKPKKLNVNSFYPWAIERETESFLRKYFFQYGEIIAEETLDNSKLIDAELSEEIILPQVTEAALNPLIVEKVAQLSNEVQTFTMKSTVKFSEAVFGERYFPPIVGDSIKEQWEADFMELCTSVRSDLKKNCSQIAFENWMSGNTRTETKKLMMKKVRSMSKSKAELISRTEVGKLNSALTKEQYQEVGLDYYQWAAGMDGRTRATHARMNTKICSWDNVDYYYELVDNKLIKKPRTSGMVHLHTGQDYNCRCIALPWDITFAGSYVLDTVGTGITQQAA